MPILQDSLTEPTEQFRASLTLVNSNGLSVTVNPALATVDIRDDDSELGTLNEKKEKGKEGRGRGEGGGV